MNNFTPPVRHAIFDSWRSIVISLYMMLVGYGVLVGIPVISTAWVKLLGFSEVEVGRLAGADLGGLSLGAVMAAGVIGRMNRRLMVVIGAALAITANVLCIVYSSYEQVLWLRLAAGIGSGIYTAVAVATLAATSNPARAFNLALFAFAFSQMLELSVLPTLSMNAIYLAFAGSYVIGLLFLPWLPPRAPADANQDHGPKVDPADEPTAVTETTRIPAFVPWLALATIVVTYINIGAYWTYIELASAASEASADWVSKVLIWASFCSVVGCLFATRLSNRFGLARPLLVTLFVQAVVVALLASGINNVNIVVSLLLFNVMWIFVDVYQMATVANIDPRGQFSALVPAAQGLGQIVGPNLAASLLAEGTGYSPVFLMCAGASLVALVIYLSMYLRLKRLSPALADAS